MIKVVFVFINIVHWVISQVISTSSCTSSSLLRCVKVELSCSHRCSSFFRRLLANSYIFQLLLWSPQLLLTSKTLPPSESPTFPPSATYSSSISKTEWWLGQAWRTRKRQVWFCWGIGYIPRKPYQEASTELALIYSDAQLKILQILPVKRCTANFW